MKAIFQVEFDPSTMFDQETIDNEFGGSWLTAMKWLYEADSYGLFENELELIEIKED